MPFLFRLLTGFLLDEFPMFVKFIKRIIKTYGYVTHVYCDSAEQVLMRGSLAAMEVANLV